MMAAGGLVAAAGFAMAGGSGRVAFTLPGWGPVELPLYRLAALVGPGAGPGVPGAWSCRRSSAGWRGLVSLPIPGVGPEALPRLSGRLLGRGLLWSSIGWILLGLSQLAVVRAFDPRR